MKKKTLHISFGAKPSKKDKRDIRDPKLALAYPYPEKYSVDMSKIDVFYQSKIGICTGAALVVAIMEYLYLQKTGKYVKLSVAFLYIVTKLYIEKNFNEGAALRSALKAAFKYGVCKESVFPTNVEVTHAQFLSQTISAKAWTDALNYTIGGYVAIPVEESLIAAAMYKYGPLYARMDVGPEWYTPSWNEKDISPLKKPRVIISGHAVALTSYDLSIEEKPIWLRNSWSDRWFKKGNGMFNFRDYKPTEVWAVTLDSVMHLQEPGRIVSDSVWRRLLDIFRSIKQIH